MVANKLVLSHASTFERDVWVNIKTLSQELTKKIELRVCSKDHMKYAANFSISESFARYSKTSYAAANTQVIRF